MEYGLIGEKLGHSFSKPIHEELADYTYDLCQLTKEEFKRFMEQKAFRAINVTIPYKRDVIPYLDYIDENAAAIGAVNTIVNKNGRLEGHNTDFSGFEYMVDRHGIEIQGKKCIILGNGGAAQAIIAVCKKKKASQVVIVTARGANGAITYKECFAKHSDGEVLINTSPVGMYPNMDASPVDLNHFPTCHAVLDVIYNPLETKLMKQARELGILAVNGLEMLVAQAKYAVEFFLETSIDDSVIPCIYENVKKMII